MGMTKRDLVETIGQLLRSDTDLEFFLKLGGKELETLIPSRAISKHVRQFQLRRAKHGCI
jgi:hypothetical protein